MTPKEKAKEITDKFKMICGYDLVLTKKCACICVYEITSCIKYREGTDDFFRGYEYWEKVKEEIQKL